jgi:hypothetical protein
LKYSVLKNLMLHGLSFTNMQFTRTATAKAPDSNNAICEPEFYHARNMRDVQDYVNAFFTVCLSDISRVVLPAF